MLNKEELRKQVIQYFRTVGSSQNIVQCIKEALFLHQEFNPVVLFEVLSRGKQKITKEDWKQYLLQNNIIFNEDELRYYLSHYGLHHETTLNQFLEALIPYNADVVRQFKQKYLDALQIKEFDAEVKFIFSQLLDNEFKFFRSIINIRQQITKVATQKQIQNLIKEDLVLKSKPRQSRKFHQQFQKPNSNLTFHELRKFLQLWVSTSEIVHQFYLLNVMRHLSSDHPFDKIVFKNKRSKNRTHSQSASKRPDSAGNTFNLTNQKVKERSGLFRQERGAQRQQKPLNRYGQSSKAKDKYSNYRNQVNDQFRNEKYYNEKSNVKKGPESMKKEQDKFRDSRYEREKKGINGVPIIKIFEEIISKEEKLQKMRKQLAKLQDFNLINLFKLIDSKNQGYITSRDLKQFISTHKPNYQHLIDFYAKEHNKLRFNQFCFIYRPLSKQLNDIIDSRPQHKVPNPFKKETMRLINEVLVLSGELHQNLHLRKLQINDSGISSNSLFIFLDLQQTGQINAETISRVLHENHIFCDSKDLKCLMRIFRKRVDQVISFREFTKFIEP